MSSTHTPSVKNRGTRFSTGFESVEVVNVLRTLEVLHAVPRLRLACAPRGGSWSGTRGGDRGVQLERAILGQLALMDFGAIDDDVFGCGDAQTDLIAVDGEYFDGDIGTDVQNFVRTARENEHVYNSLLTIPSDSELGGGAGEADQ
jgi:hypothetical protein